MIWHLCPLRWNYLLHLKVALNFFLSFHEKSCHDIKAQTQEVIAACIWHTLKTNWILIYKTKHVIIGCQYIQFKMYISFYGWKIGSSFYITIFLVVPWVQYSMHRANWLMSAWPDNSKEDPSLPPLLPKENMSRRRKERKEWRKEYRRQEKISGKEI